MKAKSLGQIAYEAAFRTRRTPKAHSDYPPAWDRVAKAVERAVRRTDRLDYERAMRTLPNAKGESRAASARTLHPLVGHSGVSE